ncbi:hypothetical protein LWC33_17280 [Pseudonocardia sp. RS11V-5]|uniref:hypothetical protein n=1 Tax=Pseudonocardia terrae TaxID=2905831 RepID=UPI001E613D89|nr:hypothetical protein [Pseudonocardia terrae]MCE3553202.1 hypothetical protein [Pseudonocardia terrae]
MTKPGRSVIALLLDRSSSLGPLRDEVRAATADLLAHQAGLPGEVEVYPTTTGRRAGKLRGGVPAADAAVPKLRGRRTEAVRDSLGALVSGLGRSLAGMPEEERPDRVFVLVVTAGADEGSSTWGPDELRDLVAAQERDYAWEIVTVTIAEHAGLAPWGAGHRSLGVAPRGDCVRAAITAASAYIGRARTAGPWEPVAGISQEERWAAYPPDFHTAPESSEVRAATGSAPLHSAPIDSAPAGNAPVDNALVGSAPTSNTPAGSAAAGGVPAGNAPADGLPVDDAPTEAIPVITAQRLAEADRAAAAERRRWWDRFRKPATVGS